jgi:hypothetical protein
MKQNAKDLHVQMSSSSYIVSCYREYETENKTKGTIFVKDKKETRRKLDRKKKKKSISKNSESQRSFDDCKSENETESRFKTDEPNYRKKGKEMKQQQQKKKRRRDNTFDRETVSDYKGNNRWKWKRRSRGCCYCFAEF